MNGGAVVLNDAQRAVLTDAEMNGRRVASGLTLLAALADERIARDAAVQRVAALEAENARLVVIVQRAIQWADWKRGGVPGAGRTWDAREADLIAALAPPAIAP